MIRLSTVDSHRLETTPELRVTIGGAESNVCVALARLGRSVAWISALPENPLGRRIATELRGHGVSVEHVLWTAHGRAGVYFMETGARPRPTRVTYDRAESAVASIDPDDLNLQPVEWSRAVHLTGITPALSTACATLCARMADAAKAAGIPVVLDVNYRSLLWSADDARRGLAPLMQAADLVLCGAGDAKTIWGIEGEPDAVASGLLEVCAAGLVVATLGEDGAVAMSREGQSWLQDSLPVDIVDPVGAGDAFAAGFLHVWLDDREDVQRALRSAVALAALSMTIPGDLAIITPDDLDATLALVDGSGEDIVR